MLGLALRSLRRRTGAFAATFLAVFLGAVLVIAFGSLADTAAAGTVSGTDQEKLITMATVVGGWGLFLVAFAVTSTMALSVNQRTTEMALLKSAGATPAQLRRMILAEAALVALTGAMLAIPVGAQAGHGLLALMRNGGQVDTGVDYAFGPVAPLLGLGVTVLAALAAAALTSRRVAHMRVVQALGSAAGPKQDGARMGKIRAIVGVVFLGLGVQLAVMGSFAGPEGLNAMQFAGSADVLFAIGMACFAPVLVRWSNALLTRPVLRYGGAGGYLAVLNLRRRIAQSASALTPVILFVGIAVGTLWMQVIQNHANTTAGMKTADDDAVRTLNFVVIGSIVAFACIMLINTLIASTTHRRRELGQQRLAGATHRQVLGMILLEGTVLTIAGVAFGTIAAMTTVLPMSIAKNSTLLPDPQWGICAGTAGVAAAVTLTALLGTAHRVLRTPAIQSVATV
ncbi:FtsX-like permease family protein [Actinomadura sp. 21ATH]|uniref:FtsX-like permease family protein n=1 Tax=Actinomadura sp. 21ATH TaxID=1735444 RepID=UPI0035C1C554